MKRIMILSAFLVGTGLVSACQAERAVAALPACTPDSPPPALFMVGDTDMTGRITEVFIDDAETADPSLRVSFDAVGTARLLDVTQRLQGSPIDVTAGGQLLASPVIQAPIPGGQVTLSGRFTTFELEDIAARIRPTCADPAD
jgi:preprotein translocase subunit SecD